MGFFKRATLPVCHTGFYFFGPLKVDVQDSAKSTLNNKIIIMSARSEQTPGRGDDSIKFNFYPVDLQ